MDLFLLRMHQRQIAHQCHASLQAAEQIKNGLISGNQEILWAGVQNLLTATANIAKATWGSGGKLTDERRVLRESLSIGDESPIANVDLRNHLEHYDERLDRWFRTSQHRNHADYMIGPPAMISGVEPTDVFRHFDPDSGDVIFWGEHYNLSQLVEAVTTLLPIAEAQASLPHRSSGDMAPGPV